VPLHHAATEAYDHEDVPTPRTAHHTLQTANRKTHTKAQ